MIYKVEYTDAESRALAIFANTDKTLIEEQNLVVGNFLIFTDESITTAVNPFRIEKLKEVIDLKKNYLNMDYTAEQEELKTLTGL